VIRTPLATLAAALALVTLAVAAPPAAEASTYHRLSDIAERYGLKTDVDLITGRHVLTDGQNKVAVLPGGYQVLVNGRFGGLDERVGFDAGDLILPAAALAFIDANLVKRAAPATSQPAVQAGSPAPASTSPARAAASRVARGTIVVDPGHGGTHTGARGRTGICEKDVNLAIARHAKAMLEERGWRVILTRSDDRHFSTEVNADLDARVAAANRSGAALFVSIHTNYAENTTAQGFEVYCAPGRTPDAALARAIAKSLASIVDDENRGVKTAGFRVIKRTSIPAVLVEVGFVSHPPTERRLATDAYRRRLAEAIVAGIDRYVATSGGE
jgi:N-acetylmuramoyl-L-alanine amidase CwlD